MSDIIGISNMDMEMFGGIGLCHLENDYERSGLPSIIGRGDEIFLNVLGMKYMQQSLWQSHCIPSKSRRKWKLFSGP